LRAKTAKKDFINPDRQIVGFVTPKSKKAASRILKILPKAPYGKIVKAKEAEMIKYFSNTYLATRVVFANQIYDFCEKLGGIRYDVVKDCLVRDPRIGNSHFDIFHEGHRGYSGGCFPKDVKAFLGLARRLGVKIDLIKETDSINDKLLRQKKEKMALNQYIKEALELKKNLLKDEVFVVATQKAIDILNECFRCGNKILLAGNGGSAAEAQHFAAEIVTGYKNFERKGYPAIALTTDSSILTAWSNDHDFHTLFARKLEALGQAGDVFVGISTSGNSKNLIEAVKKAKEMDIQTVCFLGKDGGKLKGLTDHFIIAPSHNTPRIQEVHMMLTHMICEELEKTTLV